MKKIYILFCLNALFFGTAAIAADDAARKNQFFGDHKSQVALNLGQGVNSFSLLPLPENPVPYYLLQFVYSQPTEAFRLPARINVSFVKTMGFGKKYQYTDFNGTFEWDWKNASAEIFVLSEDVILWSGDRFYFAPGLGIAMQGGTNARENSKMLFSFKLTAGYKISDKYNIELFTQHFSNGDAGDRNYSYNFWGLGCIYNF